MEWARAPRFKDKRGGLNRWPHGLKLAFRHAVLLSTVLPKRGDLRRRRTRRSALFPSNREVQTIILDRCDCMYCIVDILTQLTGDLMPTTSPCAPDCARPPGDRPRRLRAQTDPNGRGAPIPSIFSGVLASILAGATGVVVMKTLSASGRSGFKDLIR